MLFSRLPVLLLTAVLLPSLVEAGLFFKSSPVKMLDAKSFKKALRENQTSVVAFVAPWCGHCRNLAPEYEKTAKSFNGLVPLYAIDCDAQANKQFCGQQGVQGFPTVKLFPRGNQAPPVDYRGERTSKALFSWAMGQIPHGIKRLKAQSEITKWVEQSSDKPHAILLNTSTKIPLLWKVIANKYNHRMKFGNLHDEGGSYFEGLGLEDSSKSDNKVLFFAPGSTEPVLYEGTLKQKELSEFIVSVIKGKADLTPRKKGVESDSRETEQVFETLEDDPVLHEEL
ncbi:thioredoxin-like protein [Thelephora terrestris]|uniref:Thioredoxin-like protein n=1 Tax=Thelephora terrestris TaxID=56493 RepID=A0A9P6H4H0_9AGAM|nr:thioredoxin-like protein [Thelephora terrestris]